ncbi:MAG: methyltransferase [Planctomycetota bacterium]|nr:MAG: methyltransferase [Planctomycetota bacterium]
MPSEHNCRSCGSTQLITFLDLGEHPPSDALRSREQLDQTEARYPLEAAFCPDCTLVQILETVAPEELFGDEYPYYSSFSDTLLEHSKAHVQARLQQGQPKLVIELASNDGYLLQYYQAAGVQVLGIDPAKGPVEAARARGIETRHAFFTEELGRQLRAEGYAADILHANNVLAHVADTRGFVRGIAELLSEEGMAVFELPYLRTLVENCEFDTIYHEHLCYFSVLSVDRLFRSQGLCLNRVERLPIHGGSLRLFAQKHEAPDASVQQLIAEERDLGLDTREYYEGFAKRVQTLRQELRALLRQLRDEGQGIAAYGAAAKGATLILPWNVEQEIRTQQAAYERAGGRFMIPVPKPTILEALHS